MQTSEFGDNAITVLLQKVSEKHGMDLITLRLAWEELDEFIKAIDPVQRFIERTSIFLREFPLDSEFTPVKDEESSTCCELLNSVSLGESAVRALKNG